MKSIKGITLVALVITIVVMLILSAVVITLAIGERGIFPIAQKASNENNKEVAIECINLKITDIQIETYAKKQRMPNLQELANAFCIDGDFEYVVASKNAVASILPTIDVGNSSSIFVKLEDFPYEFEINGKLQLASIDGVKIANIPEKDEDLVVNMTKSELKQMISQMITEEISKNNENTSTGTGTTTVIYNGVPTGGTPIREIDFKDEDYNITDFDFIIVYYKTASSEGSIVFDTLATNNYITFYSHSSNYVFGDIQLDVENNKITYTASGNDSGWKTLNASHIKRVIGIKL